MKGCPLKPNAVFKMLTSISLKKAFPNNTVTVQLYIKCLFSVQNGIQKVLPHHRTYMQKKNQSFHIYDAHEKTPHNIPACLSIRNPHKKLR